MSEEQKEKLLNLLADRALFGLNEDEQAEFDALKKLYPEFAEDDSLDMTAGLIMLSDIKETASLPENLKARIITQSEEYFDTVNLSKQPGNDADKSEGESQKVFTFAQSGSFSSKLGWIFAAAASIALVFSIMYNLRPPETIIVKETQAPKVLTVSEQYEEFIANAKDAKRSDLFDPADAEKVIGELVWSEQQQKGFMRFDDLAANDPAKAAYQLWIFDESQDEKTPIDGGVFDILPDKKGTIVPISAKLNVVKPHLFAVTVEKPGGVVVSKREKIVALGKM